MEVPLTPDLKKIVIEKVTSRIYGSATEVIKEGLKLLKERDELGPSQVVGKEGLVPEQVIEEPQHKCQDVRPLGQDRGLFTIPEDFNATLSREFWLKYYTLSCA